MRVMSYVKIRATGKVGQIRDRRKFIDGRVEYKVKGKWFTASELCCYHHPARNKPQKKTHIFKAGWTEPTCHQKLEWAIERREERLNQWRSGRR